MILFCDTSALIKLYLSEEGSDQVAEQAATAESVVVCRIAWVEAMSALARRAREQPQDAAVIGEARKRLQDDWPEYLKLEVTQELVELAGDYADTFALRAYDSVQLAALRTLQREVAAESGGVAFACFDGRLAKAARVLGVA